MSNHDITAKLERMSLQIVKGMSDASLRRMFVPGQIQRIQEVLSQGNAQDVSLIMRDVIGHAMSILAGGSVGGSVAVQALSEAQAESLVRMRDRDGRNERQDILYLCQLMMRHRDQLYRWVQTGSELKAENNRNLSAPTDLTQIGELLAEPGVRQSAISAFVAGAAVIEAGLRSFIGMGHKPYEETQP